ncbi:MAG: hypothetical protein H6739_39320 [Alphaproteobacteria bacterium]|nr:hypothetical protein [Alphaproteobacteria bacterium]
MSNRRRNNALLIALVAGVGCKDAGTDDTAGPSIAGPDHCGDIVSDEIWSARNNPHNLLCDVSINGGTVTIEAGVEVRVQPGATLRVADGDVESGLSIQGTPSDVVVFDLTDERDEDELWWGGIGIYRQATVADLSNVELRSGGERLGAALYVEGAEVTVDGLTITGAETDGLRTTQGARLSEDSANLRISGAQGWAAWVEGDVAHTLPSAGSDYTGNAADAVLLDNATITEEVTWEDLGVPYVIGSLVDVGGTLEAPAALTIGPGAVVLFAEGASLDIADDTSVASFYAGEPGGERVVFAPLSGNDPGLWDGISASRGIQAVELHNVDLVQGGVDGQLGAALHVQGQIDVLLDGVTITGSTGYGVYLRDGARFHPDSADITITDCVGYPVVIGAAEAHTVPPEDYAGNDAGGVLVFGDVVDQSVTWEDLGVPYVIDGDIRMEGYLDAPAILTLDRGVTLQFDTGAGIRLSQSGGAAGLITLGEPGDEVTMTALRAEEDGFWEGIAAYHGVQEGDFSLSYTTMNWGGMRGADAMLKVQDAAVFVDNLTLSNSRTYGFYLLDDAWFMEGSTGLVLDGNYEHGDLPAGYLHTLPTDLSFGAATSSDGRGRGYHVIFINGSRQPATSATWRDLPDGGAYWVQRSIELNGIAVDPVVITLEPGVDMWMGDNTGFYIANDGGAAGLIADASAGDTIRFIAAEAAVAGRWQGIKALTHCEDADVVFDNVYIGYAGGAGDLIPDANLVLLGCDATLNNMTVEESNTDGLYLASDAVIDNSTFTSNRICGINIASGSPEIGANVDTRGNGGAGVCQ